MADNMALANVGETLADRYKRCDFLNNVQHIDIYGKYRISCAEHKLKRDPTLVTAVSNYSPKFTERNNDPAMKKHLENKLNKLSITTKVCGLYPGNDILSKKTKSRQMAERQKSNTVYRTGLFR